MIHHVDPSLMGKIRRHGRRGRLQVESCFQCGNCTAVCPLAQDSAGFPRRAIRMAQVGMERELLASEDLWRCYACGECTRTCPREADPAAVTLTLSYRPPYDWDSMLAFLARRAVQGVELAAEGRYARSVLVDGVQGFIVVEPAAGHCLRVRASRRRPPSCALGDTPQENVATLLERLRERGIAEAVAVPIANGFGISVLRVIVPGLQTELTGQRSKLGRRALMKLVSRLQ